MSSGRRGITWWQWLVAIAGAVTMWLAGWWVLRLIWRAAFRVYTWGGYWP